MDSRAPLGIGKKHVENHTLTYQWREETHETTYMFCQFAAGIMGYVMRCGYGKSFKGTPGESIGFKNSPPLGSSQHSTACNHSTKVHGLHKFCKRFPNTAFKLEMSNELSICEDIQFNRLEVGWLVGWLVGGFLTMVVFYSRSPSK